MKPNKKGNRKNQAPKTNPTPSSVTEGNNEGSGQNPGSSKQPNSTSDGTSKDHKIIIKKDKKDWLDVAVAIATIVAVLVAAYALKSSEKSAQAAIKAVEQQQHQFKIDNFPYLQITIPKIIVLEVGRPLEMSFAIKNIGRYAIKVEDMRTSIYAVDSKPEFDLVFSNPSDERVKNYYISTHSDEFKIPTYQPLTQDWYNGIISGKSSVFLWGYVDYINLADNNRYRYRFYTETKWNNATCRFWENENIPLPK